MPSLHLSHAHILDDENFSDPGHSEEELGADTTVIEDDTGGGETCKGDLVESVEDLLMQNNDDDSDRAGDMEKLKSIEASVDENVMVFAMEMLGKDMEAADEGVQVNKKMVDQGVQANANIVLDKEVQASANMVDKGVQTPAYSFIDFLKNDSDLHAFTGVNYGVLRALVESAKLIKIKVNDKHLCSLEERITLTLCKLKLGLSFQCLAILFKISKTTACAYFEETIHLLASILEEAIHFPDKEEIEQNLPACFEKFQDTRIILDCTEIPVQNSKCLQCRLKMYSHYKGRQTLKILIGITPSGLISYCSKCYGGRASDKSIFLQSGLLQKMIPGQDAIMVDKGFLIKSECDEYNIKLVRPPFANKNNQMTEEESLETRNVAAARVHVERCIQRLKTFAILKYTVYWDMTKYFNEIMIIVCGLVNLSAPILDKCRF